MYPCDGIVPESRERPSRSSSSSVCGFARPSGGAGLAARIYFCLVLRHPVRSPRAHLSGAAPPLHLPGSKSMHIGAIELPNALFVAPMAGVTDRPFRMLCKRLGAGYAVSEMVTSRKDLWHTLKTSRRANHDGETAPISVQIAGTDAAMMADAARYNIDHGAQIIDINMGCTAKKVCNKWAGSALMQDEPLALEIVEAVV